MKSLAKDTSQQYLRGAGPLPRPMWRAAPIARPVGMDLGHETEVIRALSLAVPLSLVLWVPLIWAAISYF